MLAFASETDSNSVGHGSRESGTFRQGGSMLNTVRSVGDSMPKTTREDVALQRVKYVLIGVDEIRKLDPRLTARLVSFFLTVAMNEGLTQGELAAKMGVLPPKISGYIDRIPDLVVARHEEDDQKKHVRLTPHGENLFAKLKQVLS